MIRLLTVISLVGCQFSLRQPGKQQWATLTLCRVNWLALCLCVTLTKTGPSQQCVRSLAEFAKVRMFFLLHHHSSQFIYKTGQHLLKKRPRVIFCELWWREPLPLLGSKESEASPGDMSLNSKLNYSIFSPM